MNFWLRDLELFCGKINCHRHDHVFLNLWTLVVVGAENIRDFKIQSRYGNENI